MMNPNSSETILSSISDAFVVLDQDCRFTYVNDRYCDIVHTEREALLGQIVWELFPEAADGEAHRQFERALSEQTPVEFEWLFPAWNRWFEYRVYPSPDGLTIFLTEISDRKQTEAALHQREAQFRQLADAMPQIVWIADAEGNPEYVSQRWVDYTGLTLEQTVEQNWLKQVIHPDDLEPTYEIWRACLETGTLYQTEFRLKQAVAEQPETAYRWFLCRAVPIHNSQGQITHWYGTLTDLHERKQTEMALSQSEERYRTLFESIDEGFCIIEMLFDENNTPVDYRFLEINPVFEQQTGLQQAIGKTARQLVPHLEDFWIETYGRVALTGEPMRFEYRSASMNRWFDAYTCRTGEPEARKVAIVFKDISDRKQAEAEREQLLAREQAAREAAEAASRIKDEFLAVVSHELRSPLNPILGWSKLLRSGQLDAEKTDRALEVIERNAQMQAQLINDLLDVSRILRGKLSLDAKPIDLVATIQAAMETVRLAAEAKLIQIHTQFEPDVGQVAGDAGRLQQVIWNLLSNAVKFTSEGGRVEVRLQRVNGGERFTTSLSSSCYAQITVTDTGKGIPPDFLPYVFEQFRQESSATTRRFGGLGLGLAIVRYLVELHGGTIQADSPGEGQGATFTVKLPLMPQQSITQPDPKPSEFSLNLQGTRILVVDDDDNTREFLAFLLELHGANVMATATAGEALTTLTQFKPEVLLSDIGMPDVDGYMLMRQVRALPAEQGGTIPAIALTAYAGEIDYQQAMAVGFQQHIAKPSDPQVLIQAIASLLEQSAAT